MALVNIMFPRWSCSLSLIIAMLQKEDGEVLYSSYTLNNAHFRRTRNNSSSLPVLIVAASIHITERVRGTRARAPEVKGRYEPQFFVTALITWITARGTACDRGP